jgi:hypothetical protein
VKQSLAAFLGGILLIGAALLGGGSVPGPAPRPDAVVVAPPFKTDVLSVLIVEQTEEASRLPRSQAAILQNSTALRQWIRTAKADFRQLDADETGEFLDSKWKSAMAVPRQSVPWIVIANPKSGFSGPLPKTIDETLALLERFK